MLGSAVIEVIIGLVFVFILLSLLVSQVNQIIANLLNLRGQQLRQRVEVLLLDETIQERVLTHPVVGILKPPSSKTDLGKSRRSRTLSVSNLSAKNFAKTLVNVLSDPYLDIYAALTLVQDQEERERLYDIFNQIKINTNNPTRANAALNQFHETIVALEPASRKDRRALLRTLGPLQSAIRDIQSGNSGLLQILNGVSQVENRAFQQAMETILSTVQNVNEAEAAIEEWFDGKMAQTKDLYGRIMQYMSLFVGLLIAVLLNVDSLHLARTLWNDDVMRGRLVAAAEALDTETVVSSNVGDDPAITEDALAAAAESYQQAQQTLQELLDLRLPIGWTYVTPSNASSISADYAPLKDSRNLYNLIPFATSSWLTNLLAKIGGLLVTAFAVAQGAPFWFDMLRRISGQQSSSTPSTTTGAAVK